MPDPFLSLERVNSYYGGAHILRDLSLEVGRGEVVALLGRNGAGKTTTLKTVMGLVTPRSGSILLEGRDIAGRPSYEICRLGLGYVPEDRRVFAGLSVAENLEVGRRTAAGGQNPWTPERLFELFPNLYERRNNAGGDLSGGEQQMLTIARTLMGNPRLLLLDEPSEGIAPVLVDQLAETIAALKQEGLTVLLSEQNLHFARALADRAYIIEGGAIRYGGGMAELEARSELARDHLVF
jgi:branched-chain amino acid transport system ATP-binding protein